MKDHSAFRTITARVIGRDASNWWRSLQIDRGSNDGLTNNLAVLNADGLIGKTIEVTHGQARVLLLSDPNCKAAAFLQDTREAQGLCNRGRHGLQYFAAPDHDPT